MRKYILTDPTGRVSNDVVITPGRYVHKDGTKYEIFNRISRDCYDTPLLAALMAPVDTTAGEVRLFAIDHWGVSTDASDPRGYTVVKEIAEVPKVTLLQKVACAIAVLARVYPHQDFRTWAAAWASGQDRSAPTARALQTTLKEKIWIAQGIESLTGFDEFRHTNPTATPVEQDLLAHALGAARAAELTAAAAPDTASILRELAGATAGLGAYATQYGFEEAAREIIDAT